jgi:hypothetical protein
LLPSSRLSGWAGAHRRSVLGGTVALELYRRHPGLVATLILIDT